MVALSMLRWSIYLCFRYFFLRFSYSLMQFPPSILKLSTQHPPYFFKLSTQHQAAITRFENRVILPTQGLQFSYTLIRAFSKISAYTKTVQFYSTENTSMNKFLAQSSSPCLMLGGIPPASLSEGWAWWVPFWRQVPHDHRLAHSRGLNKPIKPMDRALTLINPFHKLH